MVEQDRLKSRPKQNDPKPKPSTSPSSGNPVAPTASPEAQIEEIKKRKGGYLRAKPDSWYQTTDGHQ